MLLMWRICFEFCLFCGLSQYFHASSSPDFLGSAYHVQDTIGRNRLPIVNSYGSLLDSVSSSADLRWIFFAVVLMLMLCLLACCCSRAIIRKPWLEVCAKCRIVWHRAATTHVCSMIYPSSLVRCGCRLVPHSSKPHLGLIPNWGQLDSNIDPEWIPQRLPNLPKTKSKFTVIYYCSIDRLAPKLI